jgi:hypothetical protein
MFRRKIYSPFSELKTNMDIFTAVRTKHLLQDCLPVKISLTAADYREIVAVASNGVGLVSMRNEFLKSTMFCDLNIFVKSMLLIKTLQLL